MMGMDEEDDSEGLSDGHLAGMVGRVWVLE